MGTIRIIDHDRVELSNLNRQVLHWDRDIGRNKVDSASEKLSQLNQGVKIETVRETINEANVTHLVAGFHSIVDAMDNLPTRYLLNKAAIENDIPFFHGAVYGLEGRAMTVIPHQSAVPHNRPPFSILKRCGRTRLYSSRRSSSNIFGFSPRD